MKLYIKFGVFCGRFLTLLLFLLALKQTIKFQNAISCGPCSLQMDPKLRPSFPDIVRQLEDILAQLKVVEMENECVSLGGDNDKKAIPKGRSTMSASVNLRTKSL